MSTRGPATYPWIVKQMPGMPLAPSGARGTPRPTVTRAWLGLIRVLVGPEPPPVWRWSSPQERRFGYAALWVVTLALCAANLVGSFADQVRGTKRERHHPQRGVSEPALLR